MLKSQLIERLSKKFNDLSIQNIAESTTLMIDAIISTITKKKRVEVRGFGSFTITHYEPRKAHNPKTGEHFVAPGRYRPNFKAGKELRERINHSAVKKSIS